MRLSPLSVSVADYLFFREARSNAAKGKYFADDRLVSADKFAGGQTASKVGIFGEGGQFARERRGRKIAFAQDAAIFLPSASSKLKTARLHLPFANSFSFAAAYASIVLKKSR